MLLCGYLWAAGGSSIIPRAINRLLVTNGLEVQAPLQAAAVRGESDRTSVRKWGERKQSVKTPNFLSNQQYIYVQV